MPVAGLQCTSKWLSRAFIAGLRGCCITCSVPDRRELVVHSPNYLRCCLEAIHTHISDDTEPYVRGNITGRAQHASMLSTCGVKVFGLVCQLQHPGELVAPCRHVRLGLEPLRLKPARKCRPDQLAHNGQLAVHLLGMEAVLHSQQSAVQRCRHRYRRSCDGLTLHEALHGHGWGPVDNLHTLF